MFGFVAPPAPLPSMIILCIQCNPGILKPFQHGSVVGTLFTITVSMFTSIAEGGREGCDLTGAIQPTHAHWFETIF